MTLQITSLKGMLSVPTKDNSQLFGQNETRESGVKGAIGLCGPFAEQGHHDDNQSDNDCTYPEYQALFAGDKEKEEGCSITKGE